MQDLLLEAFLDISFLHCVRCELLLPASTSPGQSMSMKHYNLVMLFHFFDHSVYVDIDTTLLLPQLLSKRSNNFDPPLCICGV